MRKNLTFIVSLILIMALAAPASFASLREMELVYHADNKSFEGYLVYDSAFEDDRPGVLVVHEWWGHNEYARQRARMLAGLGYTALAVDMYGDGQLARHPEEADDFSRQVRDNLEGAERRFLAAMDLVRFHPGTDGSRVAAIGYCFGGTIVLEMARRGVDLSGVVSFHGGLSTRNPAQPGAVTASVLVLNGGEDPMVPEEQVEEFIQEMEAAEADYRVITYPGVTHGFTNPEADELAERFGLPLAYDPQADRESWEEMKAFLERVFSD